MNYFISHSSHDAQIVKLLSDALGKSDFVIFSSDAEKGTRGGDNLMFWINHNLEKCDVFVAVITENYVRSHYCLYELHLALYLYSKGGIKKIIPICSNETVYLKVQGLLSEKGLIYVDASAQDAYKKLLKTFSWEETEEHSAITHELAEGVSSMTFSDLPYIGCSPEEYDGLNRYCAQNNIRRIQSDSLSPSAFSKHLLPCSEIIVLATTGVGIIRNLRETVLVEALVQGAAVHVITANQWSDFCMDVAAIEDIEHNGEARSLPLSSEFDTVIGYLNEAYADAKRKADGHPIGALTCYSAYTLLRQTITMGLRENGEAWSWLSMTLPPKRTSANTPSFEIAGNVNDSHSLIHTVYHHCRQIISIAKSRGGYFKIDGNVKPHPYYLEKKHAMAYWEAKFRTAASIMTERREAFPCSYLIEVAAQHPLIRNCPGKEFEKRLNFAIDLYHELCGVGNDVKIYVPGSRHQHRGVADEISLSLAGVNFLKSHGIPAEDILGEEMNTKYKGEDGVYNSADECYVAARIFQDGDFGYLISICSPNQITRKSLFYYEFGVVAQCYSAPTARMYHDLISEVFVSIPNVLYSSHGWQEKDCDAFWNSREERCPKD